MKRIVFSLMAAVFFSVDSCAALDRSLTGINHQRPNQISGSPFGDTSARPLTNYLNSAAFAPPDLGTIGNVGHNSITSPGTWALDMLK
jgi:hypothetical protein